MTPTRPDPRDTDPLVPPERGPKPWPHIRIESPDGIAVLTRVYLDGVELRGVTAVRYDLGIPERQYASVTLRLYADIEIDGEPLIVKEWRNARPSRLRRLIGWWRGG